MRTGAHTVEAVDTREITRCIELCRGNVRVRRERDDAGAILFVAHTRHAARGSRIGRGFGDAVYIRDARDSCTEPRPDGPLTLATRGLPEASVSARRRASGDALGGRR